MAEVLLKNIKKIYTDNESKSKGRGLFRKQPKEDEGEEKKINLQITAEGVVAVQEFTLDIKDNEFIVLVGP